MVASDSATYASPRTAKKGGVATISPTSNNSSASIVIMDTATPTQTGTAAVVTPTATTPSNNAPASPYTPSTANTTTPTATPTSTSSTPTPTPTSVSSTLTPTDTPTPTPTTTSATNTSTSNSTTTTTTSSDDNDEDETPTATATDTTTVTPTDTPTTTDTATITPTTTDTATVTSTTTVTVTPTDTPTPTVTPTPTPATTCVTSTSSSTASASVKTNAKTTSAMAVSSLIFGTNLALFNNQDQVLTSAQAQDCLRQMHISIIRIPSRSGVDVATITQAAQMVQQLGATPLIVLHGSLDTNDTKAYSDDITIIQAMKTIFGNNTVYYEYGNNEDLAQVSAKQYTDSWNTNVPGLKQLATNGLFIGPVTYQFRPDYLQYFLQNAKPQPDAISWHEYTCNSTDSNQTCIKNLKYWKQDVQDARALMKNTINAMLPIMITEWNYAPNATQNDGKNNNSVFMTTWTARALQTLADSGVFASMQYAATNTNINLIDSSNALTVQGSVMQSEYETLVPSSSSSGTSSATPTDTTTTTVTSTNTPVSNASAAAIPATPTITPSSSAVSQSE